MSLNRIKCLFVLLLMFVSVLGANVCLYTVPNVIYFDGKTYALNGGSDDERIKIQSFPYEKYQVYNVPNLGSFYIDYLHDTIKKTLSGGHVWEPNIVELIQKHTRPGSVAVDLGSHIGTHLVSMAKAVGENGLAIGFEPQMKMFSELVQNMQINECQNVIAYRCAVGREFDEVQILAPHTSNEGSASIGCGGDLVPLIHLDCLNLENVSIMKIDVECYEDEVLAGAQETIRRNRPFIIIELADDTEERIEKRDATIKNLEGMGYQLTKLWGWDWFATPIN